MSEHAENIHCNYPNYNLNADIEEFYNALVETLEEYQVELLRLAAGESESLQSEPDMENRLSRRCQSAPARLRINRYLSPFMCNMCSACVRGGVITICGHLFCWTCLWPELYDCSTPTCPRCSRLLKLHEDIVPFHGEGPDGSAGDANVVAQPGNVPRPSGLYLQDHRYPHWFWVHSIRGEMQYYFAGERNLVAIRHQLSEDAQRGIQWMKYLQWLQICCIFVICLLSYYLSQL